MIKKQSESTTRAQLMGYGTTLYLATAITKNLTPLGKENRFNTYSINQVIDNIRLYLNRSRIAPKTRLRLTTILQILLDRLQNVIPLSFEAQKTPSPISLLSKTAFGGLRDIDAHINQLKAKTATLKGKHHVRRRRTKKTPKVGAKSV